MGAYLWIQAKVSAVPFNPFKMFNRKHEAVQNLQYLSFLLVKAQMNDFFFLQYLLGWPCGPHIPCLAAAVLSFQQWCSGLLISFLLVILVCYFGLFVCSFVQRRWSWNQRMTSSSATRQRPWQFWKRLTYLSEEREIVSETYRFWKACFLSKSRPHLQ